MALLDEYSYLKFMTSMLVATCNNGMTNTAPSILHKHLKMVSWICVQSLH